MDSIPRTEWDVDTFTQFRLPQSDFPQDGHNDVVYTVQVADPYILSGSKDGTIRIWDLETQRLLRPPLIGHEGSVLTLQFDSSPEQDVIFSGSTDSFVIIWCFSTGEVVRRLTDAHAESILILHFDDRYLATGSKDRTVKIWNRRPLSTHDHLNSQSLQRPNDPVDGGSALPEYSAIVTFKRHCAAVNAVQLYNDVVVSGSGDRMIYVWHLQTAEIIHSLNIHEKGIACLKSNGRFVVSGSSDSTVRVFDLIRGEETACLRAHTALVRTLYANFDGDGGPSRIVSGGYDGTVVLWERGPATEWFVRKILQFGQLQNPISDDAKMVAWQAEAPDRVFRLGVHGQTLICGGNGAIIEGWKFATGRY